MTRSRFYPRGAGLPVHGPGQAPGQQRIGALRRMVQRTCADYKCPQYLHGYDIVLNISDAQDANLARYIREGKSRRRYEELLLVEGAVTFRFPAGQDCLSSPHMAYSDDDPPVYIVGQRKTTRDEWHHRFSEGSEALVKVTKRLQEMEE